VKITLACICRVLGNGEGYWGMEGLMHLHLYSVCHCLTGGLRFRSSAGPSANRIPNSICIQLNCVLSRFVVKCVCTDAIVRLHIHSTYGMTVVEIHYSLQHFLTDISLKICAKGFKLNTGIPALGYIKNRTTKVAG